MKGRAVFKSALKVLLSGLLAWGILTGFCYFYYNMPVHAEDADGATDYRWEPNEFYSRGTEGFAWGRTNNEGYMNTDDFSEEERTDILVMGSSHMEAVQLAQEESAASRLNALLPEDRVYNIGVSGHTFLTCTSNLEAAIKKYQPSRYVVIETDSIRFSDSDLMQALEGTIAEIPSHSGGIVGLLQKNPYLRLAYSQLQSFAAKADGNGAAAKAPALSNVQTTSDDVLLGALLKRIGLLAQNENIQLIIVYHPGVRVQADATMQVNRVPEATQQFERLCSENNIAFLDMSDRFLQEYNDGYVLPYGFINSSVGSGHLNKHGHSMIADELYKLIRGG